MDRFDHFFTDDEDADSVFFISDVAASTATTGRMYLIDEDDFAHDMSRCTPFKDSVEEIESDENDLTQQQYRYKWRLEIRFDDAFQIERHVEYRKLLLAGVLSDGTRYQDYLSALFCK